MKNSVYLETLRLGYENSTTGISYDEIVKKLNIDLSDNSFKINYTIWFYLNFYNIHNEHWEEGLIIDYKPLHLDLSVIEQISFNSTKSYIKGDAINKYIDFIELQNTRKSSRSAFKFSIASIIIAILSIIVPVIFTNNPKPPYEVIITNERNNTANSKFDNSLDCKFRNKDVYDNKTDSISKLEVDSPKQ